MNSTLTLVHHRPTSHDLSLSAAERHEALTSARPVQRTRRGVRARRTPGHTP